MDWFMFMSFISNFVMKRSVKGKGADIKLALLRCSVQGFLPCFIPIGFWRQLKLLNVRFEFVFGFDHCHVELKM
jgi:hypothetical protein